MGNACLRGGEIHSQELEEDDYYSESSVTRLVRKKKHHENTMRKSSDLICSREVQEEDKRKIGSFVVPVEMKPAMEILPSSQEGVVRVKLIISTNQMANMINASYKKDDFLESLITSLLKEKGINMPSDQHPPITLTNSSSNNNNNNNSSRKLTSSFGSWRPALDSIPEVRSS